MATTLEKIERGLKNGIVTFRFRKLDGSIRLAIGTLQKDILATKPIRKSDGSSSPMVQVFWDLEKNAWRSFQKGTEIDIINFIPTDVDTLTPTETETTKTTETTETETKTGSREELIGKLLEEMLSVASPRPTSAPRPTSKFGEGMTDGLDIGKTLEKIFSIAMGGVPMGVVMGGGVPTETETTTDLRRKINETLGKIDEIRNELGNIEDTLKDIYYAM